MRFIVRILGNALAIYLAANFLENFSFPEDWQLLLMAGLILALFNVFLKPLLKFFSFPLIILTLGVFSLVINIFVLWLLTLLFPGLKISGLGAYFWGTIIISLTNWLVELALGKNKNKKIESQNA